MKTATAQILPNFVELFTRANAAYVARHATDANVDKDGFNPSIKQGLAYAKALTENQLETLAKLGVDWESVANGIAGASNVKKAMRAPLLLRFIVSGDTTALQGSAQTAMLAFCSLIIGAKGKSGLHFGVTGRGDENTSDEISVQRARAVQKAFGSVGVSTAPTQLSVAFSKGGLLPMLGLCDAWEKGADKPLPAINQSSKLAKAMIKLIGSLTDQTIELMVDKTAKKGGSRAKTK